MATATYGVAGEMLGLSYFGMSESRSYNSMYQLTHQSVTNTSGTFIDYLRSADESSEPQPRRRDPISVYLDVIEQQVQN